MPLQVYQSKLQKQRISFHEGKGLGPADIENELTEEFGDNAASRATIVRELRKLRSEREQEFGWRLDEGTNKKRRKMNKPTPWTVGEKAFTDEDTAIISQVLVEAAGYDTTILVKTSIALARWIARLRKAYPLQPAIVIWYAAYRAEFDEYLEVKEKIKADYRHIDRCLQFQPWKGDTEESRYEEICDKEEIGWDKNWWKSHKELFEKAESSVTHD